MSLDSLDDENKSLLDMYVYTTHPHDIHPLAGFLPAGAVLE